MLFGLPVPPFSPTILSHHERLSAASRQLHQVTGVEPCRQPGGVIITAAVGYAAEIGMTDGSATGRPPLLRPQW